MENWYIFKGGNYLQCLTSLSKAVHSEREEFTPEEQIISFSQRTWSTDKDPT